MQQERIAILPFQSVNDLRIAGGAQGGHHHCLGLAAREQRTAMRARKQSGPHRDCPHVRSPASINAGFPGQYALANN